MDNSGLELSINALVVLILAILTVGLGIFLFSQLFSEGQGITEAVTQETKERINRLLLTGAEDVINPVSVVELEKGDSFQFPFGIRYNSKYCNSGNFEVTTEFNLALDDQGRQRFDKTQKASFTNWYLTSPKTFSLTPNAKEIFSIPIKVGSNGEREWTYVFNVETKCDGSLYTDYSLQKLYVVVI